MGMLLTVSAALVATTDRSAALSPYVPSVSVSVNVRPVPPVSVLVTVNAFAVPELRPVSTRRYCPGAACTTDAFTGEFVCALMASASCRRSSIRRWPPAESGPEDCQTAQH